jgi:hypothetical protein
MTTISMPLKSARSTRRPPETLLDVESMLGHRPTSSLVLVIRRRRKPTATLRVDLPGAGPAGDFAHAVTGVVARVTAAAGAEVVVYGGQADDPDDVVSAGRLVEIATAVCARLVAAGYEVPRTLLVVKNRWADAGSHRAKGAAAGRRPVWHPLDPLTPLDPPGAAGAAGALGAADPLGAAGPQGAVGPRGAAGRPGAAGPLGAADPAGAADRRGGTAPPQAGGDPHHGPFAPIPLVPERRRTRALASLAILDRPGEPARDDEVVGVLLRWNDALGAGLGTGLPSDARCVRLAWSLRDAVVRDCVLMMCAWGLEAGVGALQVTMAGCDDSHVTEPDGSLFDTILGVGARSPAPTALRDAIDLLRRIVSCVPASITAPPLTILAWLEWSRGRGTVAGTYLDQALQVDSDYQLARLFLQLVDRAVMPEWLGEQPGPPSRSPR